MKLSELKKIVDELDESSSADYDVVLDISPEGEGESLVEIGAVYLSMMHDNTVKIEPVVELNAAMPSRKKIIEGAILKKAQSFRCPTCGKKVNGTDKHCKHCGQPLYNESETRESLKLEAKDLKIRKKLVKMHERADKRAAKVAKQIEKHNAKLAKKAASEKKSSEKKGKLFSRKSK